LSSKTVRRVPAPRNGEMNWEGLLKNPRDLRPHVVILGAGASRAAFPPGESNGRLIPVMADLTEVVGLKPILERGGFKGKGENFESIYSGIHSRDPSSPILRELEDALTSYFASMKLPPHPTLYDHLLMSLRPRDVVATFNWDPFLAEACERVASRGVALPSVAFLHGNVRVGYCRDHISKGPLGALCPKCGKQFAPTRLLYPVAEKDYTDSFIEREWKLLRWAMKDAFALTIFGYGAPATDRKAVALMKEAWSGERERKFEQTEIIEKKSREESRELWSPFVFSGHYDYRENFYESCIGWFPRRSCEALYERTVEARFTPETRPVPKELDWPELLGWFDKLIAEEKRAGTYAG